MNFADLIHPSFSLPSSLIILSYITVIITTVIIGSKLNQGASPVVKDNKVSEEEKNYLLWVFVKYPLSGLLQQLLLVIIFTSLTKVLTLEIALVLSSYIFALLHFPNFFLLFATLGLGFISLLHYSIYHNLLYIGIMHGVVAANIRYFFPSKISTSFSIWKDYYIKQKNLINKK